MIMARVLITVGLAIVAGILYRLGGSSNGQRFYRPVGLGVLTIATLIIWLGVHMDWKVLCAMFACGGLNAGLCTTYFKKKNTDATIWSWVLVGLAFSIALLPIAYTDNLWVGFAIRAVALTPAVAMWSQLIGNAVVEEFGRGFLNIITIALMFIPV